MTTRTPSPGLTTALQALSTAAAHTSDDARSRAVLAVVVQRLEEAAGAALGETHGDPLVVLQRRFGRASARLVEDRAGCAEVDLLHGLALALQPAPAAAPQRHVRATAVPALSGC